MISYESKNERKWGLLYNSESDFLLHLRVLKLLQMEVHVFADRHAKSLYLSLADCVFVRVIVQLVQVEF